MQVIFVLFHFITRSTKAGVVFTSTYPVTQVDGEDGLLPLLQEENDHEGERV